MSFTFHCPFCNQELEAEENWIGQETACPTCSKTIKIIKNSENSIQNLHSDEISCPYCGATIKKAAVIEVADGTPGETMECPNCKQSYATPPPVAEIMTESSAVPRKSGLATTAMVLSLIGMVILPLLLPGFICGIIAIVLIARSGGKVVGMGKAVTAVVIPCAWPLLLAAMLLPGLSKARDVAAELNCTNHLKQVGLAMLMYSNDNNDRFPPSLDVLIDEYLQGDYEALVCPYCDKEYTYNQELAGRKWAAIHNPSETPAAICDGHQRGALILYCDGHVELVNNK